MIVWGRKKQQKAMGEAPDLDELIATLRGAVATNATAEVVGQLVSLLTLRGTVGIQASRYEVALDDRRTAAALLRGFDGQPTPVDRHTDLLVRMGLSAAERSAGNLDEALDAAVWALEHVGTVEADDTEICEAFVADLDGIRGGLTRENRRPEARRAAELASDLATRLAEHDEPAYLGLVGSAWVNEAGARANAGDFEGAQALNQDAIALLEEHAPTSPALTTALKNRANLQRRNGEWEDAITTEKQLLADVRAQDPSSRQEIERLNLLFITQVRSGQREDAEQTISEAIQVARGLAAHDPSETFSLAVLLGNQANVRGELGRYADALTSSEESLRLREHLVLESPSPRNDEGLAMTLNNHSAVLRRLERYAEAESAASRSVELRRRNVDLENPNSVALLANSLNSQAEHVGRLGDGERAVSLALEAQELFDGLPEPGAQKRYLRSNQETLGTVLAVAGRYDEAVEAATRAVDLGRTAAASAPGEIPELASCLESLAARLDQIGHAEEAESARTEASRLRAAPAS
jgi:tetratricopeptide (TPR) repeat protein